MQIQINEKTVKVIIEDDKILNKPYYFIESDFNCHGFGSIVLGSENNYSQNFKLNPGRHFIRLRLNQSNIIAYKRIKIHLYNYDADRNFEKGKICLNGICLLWKISEDFSSEDFPEGVMIYGDRVFDNGLIYNFWLIEEESTAGNIHKGNMPSNLESVSNGIMVNKLIYHIFPDRFRREDNESVENLTSWNSLPTNNNFFGGNFRGLISKIGYLESLGVAIIYLNPIFKSHDNHRYTVDDYFEIDPLLGELKDFNEFIKELEKRGMSLILDMVFNHVSIHNQIFRKYLENDKSYVDWIMHATDYSEGKHQEYFTFKNFKKMPKLNLINPDVQRFVFNVLDFWIRLSHPIGIRYDVADSLYLELPIKIKKSYPHILHIGEIWCDPKFFIDNDAYDTFTNYQLRDLIIRLVKNQITVRKFLRFYYLQFMKLGIKRLQSINIVGSHDVPRIITVLGNEDRSLIAHAILFSMIGNPLIYYGDEVGLEGGSDPDCRRAFPWEKLGSEFNEKFKQLVNLWRGNPFFRDSFITGREFKGLKIITKVSDNGRISIIFNTRKHEVVLEGINIGELVIQFSNRVEFKDNKIIFHRDSIIISNLYFQD